MWALLMSLTPKVSNCIVLKGQCTCFFHKSEKFLNQFISHLLLKNDFVVWRCLVVFLITFALYAEIVIIMKKLTVKLRKVRLGVRWISQII